MKFRALIPLFGQKAGIPDLALDESGGASLLFDDEHEISFTADEADGSVLFCCALGGFEALVRDLGAARELLCASLLGARTGGAAFAVNDETGELVLWKRFDDDFADEEDFEGRLNAFLGQCIAWKEKAAHLQGDDAGDGTGSGQLDSLAGLGGALMI